MIWLYNRTGSAYLLELGRLLQPAGLQLGGRIRRLPIYAGNDSEVLKLEEGNGLKDTALATHGVNNGQAIKAGPVSSLLSHSNSDRAAALKMISELDKYHGLPNGIFSCDEHLAVSILPMAPNYAPRLNTCIRLNSPSPLRVIHCSAIDSNGWHSMRCPAHLRTILWAHQYNPGVESGGVQPAP